MQFKRQITSLLHSEQFAPIAWLERVEDVVASAAFDCIPTPRMSLQTLKTLAGLRDSLEQNLQRSLAFEETHLLPQLAGMRTRILDSTLAAKRQRLNAQIDEVLRLSGLLFEEYATPETWDELVDASVRLTHTLLHYLQLSEMELLPRLDFLLDDARDQQLVRLYQQRDSALPHQQAIWHLRHLSNAGSAGAALLM